MRVAGLDIGDYNGSWDKLFGNSVKVFRKFSQFLLATDGDTSILDSLKGKVNPTFAIRVQKRLFLGKSRLKSLEIQGVNFQNGL